MKKWLYATGLSLALMTSAGVQAGDKIAIVNVAQIFKKLTALDAVDEKLENEFKGRVTDLKSMEEKLRTDMEKLQRDRGIMKTSDISSM